MASQPVLNDDVTSQLLRTATIENLPNARFFPTFTARRRREMTYHLNAAADGLALRLQVSGSGSMTAHLTMPCILIEEGAVEQAAEAHELSWAHTGEQAVVETALDHRHLVNEPDAATVLGAFLDAINVQRKAVCKGGYAQWMRMMQLMTDRVARERRCRVEVVAFPPMPADDGLGERTDWTRVEIFDVTDHDAPIPLRGYARDFRQIDETTTPEAMGLMLLPPGYLVKRRHREIFHAGQ